MRPDAARSRRGSGLVSTSRSVDAVSQTVVRVDRACRRDGAYTQARQATGVLGQYTSGRSCGRLVGAVKPLAQRSTSSRSYSNTPVLVFASQVANLRRGGASACGTTMAVSSGHRAACRSESFASSVGSPFSPRRLHQARAAFSTDDKAVRTNSQPALRHRAGICSSQSTVP